MFGLNNPLPIINKPIPKKKKLSLKYSRAIEPCPNAIINAPITVAILYPKNLSAIIPPKRGVKYTKPVYHP